MKSGIALSLIAALAPLHAATLITSSYGTVSGTDDNNQAGPIRGVSYKILTTGTYTNNAGTAPNVHALSATDGTATSVEFQNLTWQRSGSTTGVNTSALYLGIFSGLTVDASGNVTSIGSFVGASTNTVSATTANQSMSWNFNNVLLTVGSTYQFVFITTNTPTLVTDISSNALELNVPGGTANLAETELVGGNSSSVSNRAAWEPVFSMTYNAVPEPATALLGGIAFILLLGRRR
ncbi:MAG: PEP-CTERM sorting domain-containing protein [Verrucomicrobiae bacterium]|nr:PEP-CTERM sorting domain-containing protein [Verrucomicrobiae bacterium]